MLDRNKIGYQFPAFSADVEKSRLKFFAKAIGETNPVYTDEDVARQAGYRSIPAPPTYPFVLDMEGPELLPVLKLLDMDIARVLHGSQSFEYFGQICAGDTITVQAEITDIYAKKGGALEFVVMDTTYLNQDAQTLAKTSSTLVYRNE